MEKIVIQSHPNTGIRPHASAKQDQKIIYIIIGTSILIIITGLFGWT